jgi:hypothetical protein
MSSLNPPALYCQHGHAFLSHGMIKCACRGYDPIERGIDFHNIIAQGILHGIIDMRRVAEILKGLHSPSYEIYLDAPPRHEVKFLCRTGDGVLGTGITDSGVAWASIKRFPPGEDNFYDSDLILEEGWHPFGESLQTLFGDTGTMMRGNVVTLDQFVFFWAMEVVNSNGSFLRVYDRRPEKGERRHWSFGPPATSNVFMKSREGYTLPPYQVQGALDRPEVVKSLLAGSDLAKEIDLDKLVECYRVKESALPRGYCSVERHLHQLSMKITQRPYRERYFWGPGFEKIGAVRYFKKEQDIRLVYIAEKKNKLYKVVVFDKEF